MIELDCLNFHSSMVSIYTSICHITKGKKIHRNTELSCVFYRMLLVELCLPIWFITPPQARHRGHDVELGAHEGKVWCYGPM